MASWSPGGLYVDARGESPAGGSDPEDRCRGLEALQ